MSLAWIDSHCHLDGFYKKGELPGLLDRCADVGMHKMIAVGTDKDDWPINLELQATYPGQIYATAGLHPCHVDVDWDEHVRGLEGWFQSDNKPCALGEIGLDFFRLPADEAKGAVLKEMQHAAFMAQLEIAKKLDAPVIIHSRHAFDASVSCIDASGVKWENVVYHCFSEAVDEVQAILERGGRASFTGIVSYKNAPKTRDALKAHGTGRLMLETDAPYLAPVPHRGKTCEPSMMVDTAKVCADVLDIPLQKLSEITVANTLEFFRLESL